METLFQPSRPMYYHRDGTPIVDNELLPATIQWALLFEDSKARTIGNTKTLYGERLSTVWLGLDHSFMESCRPLIFETMLFAPKRNDAQQDREKNRLREVVNACSRARETGEDLQLADEDEESQKDESWTKRNYPHNQLQLRYSTEAEARESHETLKMQCLIPPRWRHFLLWTIGQQEAWRHWQDDEDENDEW